MKPLTDGTAPRYRSRQIKVLAWPGLEPGGDNEYTPLLYGGMRATVSIAEFSWLSLITPGTEWDIWHMHWPESVFDKPTRVGAFARAVVLMGLVAIARLRRIKIVWTIHNLGGHEKYHPLVERWFKRWLARRVAGSISLSRAADEIAKAHLPVLREKATAVIPHGHYKHQYPNTISREHARRRIGLGDQETVLLFFGNIRRYKNVPRLIECFRHITSDNIRLIVAGRIGPGCGEDEIRSSIQDDPRVIFRPGVVSPDDVQVLMNAADVVVLPFTNILNSGSSLLALSYGRPILVPAVGSMVELQALLSDRVVRTYQGDLTVERLLDAVDAQPLTVDEQACCDATITAHFDWDAIARSTEEFYRIVLSRGHTERGGASSIARVL